MNLNRFVTELSRLCVSEIIDDELYEFEFELNKHYALVYRIMDKGVRKPIFSREGWEKDDNIRSGIIRDVANAITEEKLDDIYYIIKSDYNWADEADFPGFSIVRPSQYEQGLKIIKEFFDTHDHVEIYVGTNESIDFSSAQCVETDFEVMSKKEADIVKSFMGGSNFGEIHFNRIVSYLEDYD